VIHRRQLARVKRVAPKLQVISLPGEELVIEIN
jgi:hypothetical protein